MKEAGRNREDKERDETEAEGTGGGSRMDRSQDRAKLRWSEGMERRETERSRVSMHRGV